jgi:hypothetical protein
MLVDENCVLSNDPLSIKGSSLICEERGHLIMSNGSKPSGSEPLAQVLGEVDMDELEEAIKARMETTKKASGFHESVDGPDDETKYILHKDGLPSDRYHELARMITEAVLDVNPRKVATVGVQGIDEFLRNRNEEAVKTLLESEISYVESEYNDGTIEGRCAATPDVVEAVLSLYIPGLTHAYFLDSEGEAIAARFDDTLQYYWLSERAYRQLGERLNPDLFSAVMTQKELEQIIERERQDR